MNGNACCTSQSPVESRNAETAAKGAERPQRTPAVDIYETGDGITVLANLPGVEPQGVEINVENRVLTLTAHVAATAEPKAGYREFELTDYRRQFRLSEDADQEKIAAELNHGVLKLTIPRREATKPRQVEVKVG